MADGTEEMLDTDNFYISSKGKIIGKDGDAIGGRFVWTGQLSVDGKTFTSQKVYKKRKRKVIYYWGDVSKNKKNLTGYWGYELD